MWEPDEQVREAYFRCKPGKTGTTCRSWVVPAGAGDAAAAREISYRLYKTERCPKHSIWRSTRNLMVHPAFVAGLSNKDLPLARGGVFDQPSNFSAFVRHAQKEYEWFLNLVAERDRKKKKP